jgi:hypothetical protein
MYEKIVWKEKLNAYKWLIKRIKKKQIVHIVTDEKI